MINNQWNFNGNTYLLVTKQAFSQMSIPYMTDFRIPNCITQQLLVRRSNVMGVFLGEWKEIMSENIHNVGNAVFSKQLHSYKGKCYYEAIKHYGMPIQESSH